MSICQKFLKVNTPLVEFIYLLISFYHFFKNLSILLKVYNLFDIILDSQIRGEFMENLTLGIELGSTRIKSILINDKAEILAQGSYEWENKLVDGLWSYSLDEVEQGLQTSYQDLLKNYNKPIYTLNSIGISAMMHGYLAFDKNDNLLAPFRTWRNTNASKAGEELSNLFKFNLPMRWSVAQYYQSVLDNLSHVKDIAFLTTLSGYVHYRLTGKKVLGINDASGMFPILGKDYDGEMLKKFNSVLDKKGIETPFERLLPKVLVAGENAGELTSAGAKWLDVSGNLNPGIKFCPPEGDMGTGLIATNTVKPRTGNISAGTSANLTIALERPLKGYYPELDVICTPNGHPAVILHSANCTNEINAWANLFDEVLKTFGFEVSKGEIFNKLFEKSLESDENVGGLLSYNFLSGEHLAGTEKGTLLLARGQDGKLNLANFMQAQVYSAISTLALGVDILNKEDIKIDSVLAHGGFYKTDFVGQNATSAVLNAPVTVLESASEGGAYGMALLALYLDNTEKDLGEFIDEIFANAKKKVIMATDSEKQKFNNFICRFKQNLPIEKELSKIL